MGIKDEDDGDRFASAEDRMESFQYHGVGFAKTKSQDTVEIDAELQMGGSPVLSIDANSTKVRASDDLKEDILKDLKIDTYFDRDHLVFELSNAAGPFVTHHIRLDQLGSQIKKAYRETRRDNPQWE